MPVKVFPRTKDWYQPKPAQRLPFHVDLPELVGEGRGINRLTDTPIIRQSLVTAFEDCPRKGILQWAYSLRPYHRASALDRGSYAHHVCRMVVQGQSPEQCAAWAAEAYQAVIRSIARKPDYQDDVRNLSSETLARCTTDMNIGLACGIRAGRMLESRIRTGKLKPLGFEVPLKGEMRLGNTTFEVRGQLDMVFQDAQGRMCPWDLKTTDEPPAEFGGYMWSKIQPVLYVESLRQQLVQGLDKGLNLSPSSEFLAHVVRKPGIKWKSKGSKNVPPQSLADYLAECDEWLDGTGRHADKRLDRQSQPPCIIPVPVPQPAPSWAEHRVKAVLSYMTAPFRLDSFPPHERHCRDCQFHGLCSDVTGRTWRDTLSSQFTQDRDPLDSDPSRVPLPIAEAHA